MGRLKATWEGSEVEEVRYVYMYIYVFLYMGLDMGWMGSFEFGGRGGGCTGAELIPHKGQINTI
jgi:hypothetical protein